MIFIRKPAPAMYAGTMMVLAAISGSCSPAPPPLTAIAEADPEPSHSGGRAEDVCAIYRSMFPASVIRPLDSMFGDPRISTVTEGGGGATRSDVRATLASAVGASEAAFPWDRVPEDLLAQAFRFWRPGPLPDCDWQRYAREVSAPARNGQIGPVLTRHETGSYTRVSRPFFINRDSAVVLVRESEGEGAVVRPKLVFTYRDGRDGHDWAMIPHTFEETVEVQATREE
ncbi:MAG TPA: hypothetical protein VF552_09260 [Allosphingosinicella sp.]|jgi:hypothetical protein